MSNPEKRSVANAVDVEIHPEEIGSDDEEMEVADKGGEEAMMRELILGLRALGAQEELWDEDDDDDDNNAPAGKVKVTLGGVASAADEGKSKKAEVKASGSGSGSKRRSKKGKAIAGEATGSGAGQSKKKRNPPILRETPKGPPICPNCQRRFTSWKAVFGHLRSHTERNYQGCYPPPDYDAEAEGIIVRRNRGSVADAGSGGGVGGDVSEDRARGRDFDLNVLPDEALPEEAHEETSVPRPFDLNQEDSGSSH